jgi:hypothetical protein
MAVRLHRDPVETQLRNLAAAGRDGVLRVSGGEGSGAIHLREGVVAYAESDSVPGMADRLAGWTADGRAAPTLTERGWVAREATADAAACLLSGSPRYGRFRAAEVTVPDTLGMPVPELLAEVARRREIIGQMSAVLTADTAVRRDPLLRLQAVQVSAAQWALLIRMAGWRTPRSLAVELGGSVFGATIEVFRMIRLSLVSAADRPGLATPAQGSRAEGEPGSRQPGISFLRAVAGSAE